MHQIYIKDETKICQNFATKQNLSDFITLYTQKKSISKIQHLNRTEGWKSRFFKWISTNLISTQSARKKSQERKNDENDTKIIKEKKTLADMIYLWAFSRIARVYVNRHVKCRGLSNEK